MRSIDYTDMGRSASVAVMLTLALLGAAAGLITTLSGFGGGLFLVSCLALLWDPLTALTLSSLALLVGNAQRLYLFRHEFAWRYGRPVVLGGMPGALLGALVATQTPDWLLHAAIAIVALLALVRLSSRRSFRVAPRLLAPGSAAVGFLSATTGGGGFLMGPLLLGSGLRGNRYIAAGASAGVAMHSLKILGYSSAGLIGTRLLAQVLLISVSIMLGNTAGRFVRHALTEEHTRWLEIAAPVVCAGLAIAGL